MLKDVQVKNAFSGGNAVAYLPKGSAVQVICNFENYFMLKTPFGLIGWLKILNGDNKTIDSLYTIGD